MSDKYKVYLEQKRLLEEKQVAISKMLTDCKEEMKILHMQYIKSSDHSVLSSQIRPDTEASNRYGKPVWMDKTDYSLPVCAICKSVVSSK
jgi:hypothetical protein